jgi:thymidine kinase
LVKKYSLSELSPHIFSERKKKSYMSTKNLEGHIELILGPMFSGKTTELLRRLRRYEIARHKCLLIKHKSDDRYSESDVQTHDKIVRKAISCTLLSELEFDDFKNVSVIGIDEGQFFEDLPEFCDRMSSAGKIVVVSALSGTFKRELFASVKRVLPYAESWTHLKAVCMDCGREAPFTKRIVGGEQEVEIGGEDKYKAVCRQCWSK